MSANEVAVHDVEKRPMHRVLEDLAEGTAALSDRTADRYPVALPGHLPPPRSDAYRRAVALLGIFFSRADFLRHCEIDNGTEIPLYRFRERPVPIGRGSAAAR
jgi:hypothetical protein